MPIADIAEFTAKKVALEAQRAKMLAEEKTFNDMHADFVKEVEKIGKETGVPVGGKKFVVVSLNNVLKVAVFTQPTAGSYNLEWEDPIQGVS